MTRKSIILAIIAVAVATGASTVLAESPFGAEARSPSRGMAAVQHAAAANKYLFVFFWKEKNQQGDVMWEALQSAMNKVADRAESVVIQASDPAEKAMVTKFGVDRAPLPLVLAIAPNGAVTKGFSGKFHEDQLSQAFVSPGTARVLKGLQARKLVMLVVEKRSPYVRQVSLQKGVVDFTTDARFAEATEIVAIDPTDPGEAAFLQNLRIDPQSPGQTTALLAPPGSIVGVFTGNVTKEQLVAKLKAAQSSSCPGGKCGPGGCCPK